MTQLGQVTHIASRTLLKVRLGGKLHAIPIEEIEEVLPALPVEPIAQSSPWLRGVVFVRGHLIPVLDGVRRLGFPVQHRTNDPHIVCLRWQNQLLGLEVEEALDLIELPEHPDLTSATLGVADRFVSGVVDLEGEIIRVLNVRELSPGHDVAELAKVGHP
ncbi:chemotaxis protein CheW [Planctomicrobium sp. SH664]|uniref:chemotaxis protein CheW n=1 Tax=Planctomicrobium sp. SH664 TaxID=3448125 RepID=UPI003F5AE424